MKLWQEAAIYSAATVGGALAGYAAYEYLPNEVQTEVMVEEDSATPEIIIIDEKSVMKGIYTGVAVLGVTYLGKKYVESMKSLSESSRARKQRSQQAA